jgi:hypothetical protein
MYNRIISFIRHKVFIWAPKVMRQMAMGTIWIWQLHVSYLVGSGCREKCFCLRHIYLIHHSARPHVDHCKQESRLQLQLQDHSPLLRTASQITTYELYKNKSTGNFSAIKMPRDFQLTQLKNGQHQPLQICILLMLQNLNL